MCSSLNYTFNIECCLLGQMIRNPETSMPCERNLPGSFA
jgi:hypothetical protein